MPDATITSTASTFGTISGTFAADQSTVTGTVTGNITGTLTGSVGVPGPAGAAGAPGVGVPVGGTAGQFLTKIDGTNYNTDWTTVNLSVYAVKANNLSDLADAGTARTNLGLGTMATATASDYLLKAGGIITGNIISNNGASFISYDNLYKTSTLNSASVQLNNAGPGGSALTLEWDGITFASGKQTVHYPGAASLFASPVLTGDPTAPTPATSDNDTSIATTAFVKAQGYLTSAPVTSVAGRTGAITLSNTDISGLGSLAVVNDAPSNGSQYARKNGAWDVVTTTPDFISSVSSPLSVTTGNLTIDLSAYLTSATAASTYQTLAGMSSYLTTATAASTYYLQTNPSGFQTAGDVTTALSPYLLSATAASTYAVIAAGQPTAGTTGQVLTKNSGTNYDSSWATLIPGDRYLTSSTTSNTVSNGNKTFTIGTGLSYTPTQNITISYDASNHMHGEVLTYNSGTGVLTVDINHHTGSGTYTAWVVNVGGVTPATSVAWGAITGTLSSQTDLQSALDLKLAATTAASTYQTLAGMSSYLTTSTAASTYQTLSGMSSYLTTATAATTYATILEPSVDGILTVEPSGVNSAELKLNQDANNYIHLRPYSGQIVMVYGGATKWFFSDTYLQFPGGSQQTVAYPGSSTFLLKADNLSGLADTAVSRTNLGLGTMAVETASNYLTTATAASTYQTISGMSSYLTTATAASTYQTLSGMSSYLTSATAASTYFTIANAANKADLASPTFTGSPSLPTGTIAVTQSPGNNTTALATTAFVTAAVSASTGATWGSITGTLSSQTDLQSALDAKLASTTAASTYQTISGMSSYLTTATAASTYYPLSGNPSGFLTSAPVTSVAGRTGAITLSNTDISGLGTMSTATAADYSTTTVANGLYYPLSGNPSGFLTSAPVTSVAGRTGAITLAVADVSGAAPLASPSLTGTPLSTTAAVDTNTTQIATTAYVVAQAASATPLVNGTAAVGTSLRYARADHVHGTDTTRAPLASPTFTGTVTIPAGASISGFAPLASPTFTGTPTLPTGTIATTQTAGNNTTAVATTAFVTAAIPTNNIKAWVNFNGTGTPAIRASLNVSSITDNGTGDYTVNFTTAMTDANYAAAGFCGDAGFSVLTFISSYGTYTQTTTAFRLKSGYSGGLVDTTNIHVAFHR